MNTDNVSHSHSHCDNACKDDESPHEIFIPKYSIFKKFLLGLKLVDDLIYQIYSTFVGNFDLTINDMELSKFFKNILHTRQILFFYIFFGNFWMVYSNIKLNNNLTINESEISTHEKNLIMIKTILYLTCMISFSITLFLTFYLKIKDFSNMKIRIYNELEQYILLKNKELKKNVCHVCKVVRCMRSFHCNYCNRCVTKFELHSNWFNTCVGSENNLVYVSIIFFLCIFLIFCLFNYFLQIFVIDRDSLLYDFKSKLFYLHFWFSLTFYLAYKLIRYANDIIRRGLFFNLTQNERINWIRFPYLWRNASKEFFNPFDRGVWNNIKDVWASWRNKELDISERINIDLIKNENLNVSETISSDKTIINLNSTEDDFVLLNNESCGEKKEQNKLTKESEICVNKLKFDYFVTSDEKVCYQTYDPINIRTAINWNRMRLYTLFDLINSPFRKLIEHN